MNIKHISAVQILDSRGVPTLRVNIVSDSGKTATFSVPSGQSRGKDEAVEKRDGGETYGGMGVTNCIKVITEVLAHKFTGYPLAQQEDFDSLLIALDGTPNKQNLGSNTILGLSAAYLKLSAAEQNKPVWQYIAEVDGTSPEFPRLFATIFGGGKHAPGVSIEEFMAVPQTNQPLQAVAQIDEVYHTAQTIMQNLYGPSALLSSDDGGLAPVGANIEVMLEAMSQLATKQAQKFDVAIDAAANSFFADQTYQVEAQKLHASDLNKLYQDWHKKFGLYAIEDPFAESDLEGLEIIKGMPKDNKEFLIIADDYTVSNGKKIEELNKDKIFDAIVIKPSQIGSISETFAAIKAARSTSAKVIISQRLGETNDDLIVDLAYGIGAMGLKIGAPVRGERVAKYNRLLEIEAGLEDRQATNPAQATNVAAPTLSL
ncbi:hypothetical protein HYX70_04805 [Candidatus Saccharibacteria bacterium]|nr:hypothetical protein [Candidatus Saccharibacteria bacterium]